MISTSKFIVALIKAFILVASSLALESIKFGYKGTDGPDKWGSLNKDWKICNSGSRQSPINIVTYEAKRETKRDDQSLKVLTNNYIDANATLINNRFNVELKFESEVGTVAVDGKNYSLQNLHWHSPSEHTINGQRYPVELHLVHKSKDGEVAVVAVLYKFGKADAFLSHLQDGFKELAEERVDKDEAGIAVGVVRANELKHIARVKYYRYAGSLTVPPCTENVVWSIMGRVREMTRGQAEALKAPLFQEFKSNSRPVQLLNERTVQVYSRHHDN